MAIDESKQQQIGAENSNTKCVGPDSVVIADKSARIDLTDSLTGVIKILATLMPKRKSR
jgi:hypothetical protein